jgi:hypothetical protein
MRRHSPSNEDVARRSAVFVLRILEASTYKARCPIVFEHADRLTQIFGAWPSFHDAEVLGVQLARGGTDGPTCEARIHLFERTSEVDAAGFFVLRHHTEVTFRFTGVSLEGMAGINEQNVLEDLVITELDPAANRGRCWRVELVPSYGLGATLECKTAVVIDVRPFTNAA